MTVKYIIGHWTAGATYIPTNYEKEHYQLLIDNNKKVYFGKKQGTTASTGGMNSITYNIACCGGLEKTPLFYGQVEEFCYQAAKSLKIFNLPVNKFYTHAEIGEMTRNYLAKSTGKKLKNPDCNGNFISDLLTYNFYLDQNIGKIDLRELPDAFGYKNKFSALGSGDYLRKKILWYYNNKFKNFKGV